MKFLFKILLFLLIGEAVKAQSKFPIGLPSPHSTNWYEVGYIQADSASIPAYRDTSFAPRFQGTTILWLHPSVDSVEWWFIGNKWIKKNSGGTGGTGLDQLTGDVLAGPGTGSQPATLAIVNTNIGSFGDASHVSQITLNGKGLSTAAVAIPIQIPESQVTNLVTDLAGKQSTGSYITSLTTDVVAAGPGAAPATIQPSAVTTGKINNNAVTYAKIQAASGQSLLGATGAGNFQELTLGTNLSITGTTLNAAGGTSVLYSKNQAIAVSGDSVQAQNLAFVDSTSNGVLGVLYDSLTWNSPLGYLQQSGSGVTVSSNQIQLVEADNNGTVYVRLPTNTCLDQQNLSANFVIKATNSGDSGAMISLVSVNTHSISSLFARLNTTTRKVELLSNQNGSTTIITSVATLPTSIATGDSITLQLINNNQVITAQATDRTTANTISVSFSNTFAFGAPLFIANTGQVTFNSGNGTYQLNRLTYSSNLPKNQRLGVVGYSITQGYAAGSIAGTWSRSIGGVVSAGSADYSASILLPGRLQEMHALGERNWIIGGLLGNDIQFGISPAVWQANVINAYDSIISWGSNCYFTLETPRNGVDITAANTFIKATFPNLYIDLFTPLWSGTSYTMNAAYVTDGTHPNAAGHAAMSKATEQSFVYNLIQNGAQIPIVTPITPGAATTVQVSTGAGLAGYSEFFYNHALTQLYSPLIAGSATAGQGIIIHSNSGAGDGTISFGSPTTGMNYKENNASLAIGTSAVTSGTKLDVRGGGLRVGTTNAAMIFPDYAGSGPATAGSVLIACGACGSGQGLVLDANSNAGTSGAFVKAVAYNGTTLRTVWEYSNTTGGAVPTLKIMDSAGFVQFGATSADTLSSKARGSYTTNLGSTFTPYSWIDYNSADSLAKKRAHDSAVAYAGVSSVSNSNGTLTISPTTGAVVASLALGHANTWTGKQTQPAPIFTGTTSAGPNDSVATIDPATGQVHWRSGTINLTFSSGVHPAPTLDSVLLGGTLNQTATIATNSNSFLITGLPNKSLPLSTDSAVIEDLTGKLWKLPAASGGMTITTATPGTNISSVSNLDSVTYINVNNVVHATFRGTATATTALSGTFTLTVPFTNITWNSGGYGAVASWHDITTGADILLNVDFASATTITVQGIYPTTNQGIFKILLQYDAR